MTGSKDLETDVVVVGAGPAGLAAAVVASESGLRVVVVDAGQQPGGQYWRHPDEERSGGKSEDTGQHDWRAYLDLRRRFDRCRTARRLTYLPGTQVWLIESSGSGARVLRLTRDADSVDGPATVRTRSLVLCPGGYDRQLPVTGWDLPGVMAAGGVQALLKGSGTLAGRRAVVAGTGPFLLPVATGLAEAGAEVVEVCEASAVTAWIPETPRAVRAPAKLVDAATYTAKMIKHRIPYRTRTVVTAVHGDDEVRSATVARVDAEGSVRPGSERQLEVDLVALGWGFTPSLELLVAVGAETRVDVDGSLVVQVDDQQRTSVPHVWAAGEATGVGGAVLAVQEGTLAGLAVAADHGRTHAQHRAVSRLRRRIARSRAFAQAMHRAHPVPRRWSEWLTDATTVCRCEEVSFGDICRARDELGAHDARTIKLLTRPGMGWCQGRVCGFATARLAADTDGRDLEVSDLLSAAKRPLCAPVSLAELARIEPA